jgi:hypothetical protein
MRALMMIDSHCLRDISTPLSIPACLMFFPFFTFTPTIEIIGGTIRKLFNGPDAALTKRNEHERVYARNIPQCIPVRLRCINGGRFQSCFWWQQ